MKLINKKNSRKQGIIEIYGIHAVRAAIKNTRRKYKKLTISENLRSFITPEIKKNVEKINQVSNKEMFKLHGAENNHQGIVLSTSALSQPSLDEILENSKDKKIEVVVMLDRVTDPNNIGSIMRSSSLFNCKSIIVARDNSPDITPSMTKAASGALETVNYIKVINLSSAIQKFKKNNFWVYGFDSDDTLKNNILDMPKKILLVFGSEGRGLRTLTKKECDGMISIPINLDTTFNIDSLNVSNACSIALYEHYKKYK